MDKATVYNQEGKKVSEHSLSAKVFNIKVKPEVIWQVVISMQANARIPWAHTKDRSDVRGGGKKPWRQKGTGRARHGSSRSPIWIGGGVTFGPRNERNYKVKINKKVKQQALKMSLADKASTKNLIILEDLKLNEIKTKSLFQILQNLKLRKKKVKTKKTDKIKKSKTKEEKPKIKKESIKSVLIITEKKDDKVSKSARNIPKVQSGAANNLNLIKILNSKHLIVTKKALTEIEKNYK